MNDFDKLLTAHKQAISEQAKKDRGTEREMLLLMEHSDGASDGFFSISELKPGWYTVKYRDGSSICDFSVKNDQVLIGSADDKDIPHFPKAQALDHLAKLIMERRQSLMRA